jgi:hypothetical protein
MKEQPLHPAIEALVVALARKLVRDELEGKLPPLPEGKPSTEEIGGRRQSQRHRRRKSKSG